MEERDFWSTIGRLAHSRGEGAERIIRALGQEREQLFRERLDAAHRALSSPAHVEALGSTSSSATAARLLPATDAYRLAVLNVLAAGPERFAAVVAEPELLLGEQEDPGTPEAFALLHASDFLDGRRDAASRDWRPETWVFHTGIAHLTRGHSAYLPEVQRLCGLLGRSPAFADWWAPAGDRWLGIIVTLTSKSEEKTDRIRLRAPDGDPLVSGELVHVLLRAPDPIPSTEQEIDAAQEAVRQLLRRVGKRLRLGVPPPLPESKRRLKRLQRSE